jgi:hypothetical protein
MSFSYKFKMFVAALYIMLGIAVFFVKLDWILQNQYSRLAFSVLLIAYGSFRAYTIHKDYKDTKAE